MAIRQINYQNTSFSIAYDIQGSISQPAILFLHGWGSSKELMKQAFHGTFSSYCHIYIDMPGFGHSSSCMVLTTYDYANIIQLFLNEISLSPSHILGHSFGGKVATLLSPPSLILVASAGVILKKSLWVRSKIISFKLMKKVGLGRFWRLFASQDTNQMNELMYGTFKNVVDENFLPVFSQYTGKAYLIYGSHDTATPPFAGELIHQAIQNSHFLVVEGDHYFFLKKAHTIDEFVHHS